MGQVVEYCLHGTRLSENKQRRRMIYGMEKIINTDPVKR